jgi:poly(beta-D-mannuronate) C5 epimerase
MSRRRNGIGVYVLVLLTVLGTAAVAAFVLGKIRRTVYSTSVHFHRHLIAGSLDPIAATERGFGPTATSKRPGKRRPAIRAVVVRPTKIVLLAGGRQVRVIPTATSRLSLRTVVGLVGDRRWLEGSSTVRAHAALIAGRGSELVVDGAQTPRLVLDNRAGVFLAARGASLRLDRVVVRAARGDRGALDTRPFVFAQRGSRMVIRNSTFDNLGHDWNSSYGVSWSSGSTGAVTGSRFARCYIGVYTAGAHDVVIRGNRLHDNTLYGIDPHSDSRRIVVERNVANHNGRHGIIFSERVTSSIVRGNVTRGNRLNGIVMDAASDHNTISGNVVESNRGDGIVLASSSHNIVIGNRVSDNRVGVLVRGASQRNRVAGNVIRGNVLAAQGAALDGNDVQANGGQWRRMTLIVIAIVAVAAAYLLLVATWSARRARDRGIRSRARLRRVPR